MELLRCSVEALPSVTVVHVAGEIDLSTTGKLMRILETVAETHLVVDLDSVTYLDGAAIRLFDQFRRRCGDRRLEFALACVPRHMRRILDILDLDPPIATYNSVREALAVLEGRAVMRNRLG